MPTFNSTYSTQLQTCQFSQTLAQLHYIYVIIDDICEDNQGETKVEIYDEKGSNQVYNGQYYILKRGIAYIMKINEKILTKQIQLKFQHLSSGTWKPEIDINMYDNIEILNMGETIMTADNKYSILNRFNILKEQDVKFTKPYIKQFQFKIYIKIITSEYDSDKVRVNIINENKINRLLYGDYYELNLNTEYCIFSKLIVGEQFTLVFSEKVTFEWIPDFPIDLDISSGIKIMRRGEYFPTNHYYFDDISCKINVKVSGKIATRMWDTPLSNIEYNNPKYNIYPKYKLITYIKRHEKLTILRLYGDFGFTTFNKMSGWICIRHVTKLGNEGDCACNQCKREYLDKQPFELYLPKLYLQINQVIIDQIQRQIYQGYNNCQCQHCNLVKSRFELFIDEIEMIKYYYQKGGRCVDYNQISQYLKNKFKVSYSCQEIQKILTEKILPKMKQQVPESMMCELHKLSLHIHPDQLQLTRDVVVRNMNVLMKDYDTAKVKERLRKWITNKEQQRFERLTRDQLISKIHIIIHNCSFELVMNQNIKFYVDNDIQEPSFLINNFK
ncbi:Hypothetical_protein [Hexamita inflata]|uniref:Hypothetical_protein n=1 Tax=Hexamita inflata TaxID=28002 RepID=A0AA86UWB6_9EUKA|nr:Hypothetical protein HINF_LOCUS54977 [Hexamita inflata]